MEKVQPNGHKRPLPGVMRKSVPSKGEVLSERSTAQDPADEFQSRPVEGKEGSNKRAPRRPEGAPLNRDSEQVRKAVEFKDGPQATLVEPAQSPSQGQTLSEVTAEILRPGRSISEPKKLASPPLSPGRKGSLLRRLGRGLFSFLSSDNRSQFEAGLEAVNQLEPMAKKLQTKEQFQAKTAEFKQRLADGESLDDIRNEAYAVAREAAWQTLKMRPYDCQVAGALAMDDGHIAEMRTGEGKTLTAVMPLYLNALKGKGAHLVTVNDTLASRDAKEMGPVFERLGLSVGTVLEDMKVEEKKAGYNADITYTTDRALGFDYLRDRTAKNPNAKVQRDPFFALIDEVDEVLIDEARSPLIISIQGENHAAEYRRFDQVVQRLTPGQDYFLDRKRHSVWLSDSGYARVENMLQADLLQEELASTSSEARRAEIKEESVRREQLDGLLTAEQLSFNEYRAKKGEKPGFFSRLGGADWEQQTLDELQASHQRKQSERLKLQESLPEMNLADEEHDEALHFLQASLKAHALFERDKDYTVLDGKVEIVDQNKGRTSEGRRYNDGVHQALEAKEGVDVRPEQSALASITYPNLFKLYPRLAGMSGTAKSSEGEFVKLYDLDVVQIETNEPVIRIDQNDLVFRTLKEKYDALARDAAADFKAGQPVLIGTLSVEHNEYVAELLEKNGVPRDLMQVLNAETVRGDKEGENQMIGQAGRSGVITVATNLAGRGANIKPDLINFKKLAHDVARSHQAGTPTIVTVRKQSEAEWLSAWLGEIPTTVVSNSHQEFPGEGEIQIRYSKNQEIPETDNSVHPDTVHLRGEDYPTGGLTVYGTERSTSRRIDDQLIGRAGRQGAPGRSRFYLSLEDDLLRVFAQDQVDSLLNEFVTPGVGVSSERLDQVIAEAQSSIQADHFVARESTNEADEVLNLHRNEFFAYRDQLLNGGKALTDGLERMAANSLVDEVFRNLPNKKRLSYGEITEAVDKARQELGLPVELPFLSNKSDYPDHKRMDAGDLEHELRDLVNRQTQKILRSIKKSSGNVEGTIRPLLLDTLDRTWSGHLEAMEILRTATGWRSLAEKDPEVEFKLEAFDQFQKFIASADRQVTTGLFKDLLAYSTLFSSPG